MGAGHQGQPQGKELGKTLSWSPWPSPWHPMGAGEQPGTPRHPQDIPSSRGVGGLARAFSAPKPSPALVALSLHAQTHAHSSKMFSMPPRLPSDVGGPGERNASDRVHVSSRCRSAPETSGDLFCRRLTRGASELRRVFQTPLITTTKKKLIYPKVNKKNDKRVWGFVFFYTPHNSKKGGKNKASVNPPVPHHDTDLHL